MKIFNSILVLIALCFSTGLFAQENCIYEYDPSQTSLEWTAFKFTEKTGVKGKFDSIKVVGKQKDKSKFGAVNSLQFQIDSSSVNSGVPDRDGKLKILFGSVKGNKNLRNLFRDHCWGNRDCKIKFAIGKF